MVERLTVHVLLVVSCLVLSWGPALYLAQLSRG